MNSAMGEAAHRGRMYTEMVRLLRLSLFIVTFVVTVRSTASVVLGALLPLSGAWAGGPKIVGALPLAVERVNADPALLPGRTLEYVVRDSQCSAAAARQGFGELTSDGNHIDAVLGPGCSSGCETVNHMTKGQNLASISFSCASRKLSEKQIYPTVSFCILT